MKNQREPGSYIGQRPDENTDDVRSGLQPGDERVAVSNSRSSGEGAASSRQQESGEPHGHRKGPAATDDDVRRAGDSG